MLKKASFYYLQFRMGKTPKSPKTQLQKRILLKGHHKSAENSDDESGIFLYIPVFSSLGNCFISNMGS